MAQSSGFWYVEFSREPLPRYFCVCPWDHLQPSALVVRCFIYTWWTKPLIFSCHKLQAWEFWNLASWVFICNLPGFFQALPLWSLLAPSCRWDVLLRKTKFTIRGLSDRDLHALFNWQHLALLFAFLFSFIKVE